ncbi:MAG: hypothetical protein AAB347_01425 [Bacteroidota bacterium]|mgnify:FL=1
MIKNVLRNLLVLAILAAGVGLKAQNGLSFDKYKTSYQEHKPETIYTSVPSYGFSEYQFLVEGKGDIKVNYSSRKAGNLVKIVKL